MCVGSDGNAEGPRKPKVGQFDDATGVDEQVLGLEISMQDSVGVAECNTIQHLVDIHLEGGREGE